MTGSDLDVSRYLRLARLALPAARTESLRDELDKILARFAAMRRADVSAAQDPDARGEPPRSLESARDDVVTASRAREAIAGNALTDGNGSLRVPRVIE